MTEQVPKIAIYLDFENLAISAKEVYPLTPKPLRIDDILDYAKGYGDVLIKKAFADWNKPPCSQYVEDLRLRAFDLVFLPQTSLSGKNGADLKAICMEAGMFAIRREREAVSKEDFLDAIEKIGQDFERHVIRTGYGAMFA